MYTTLHKIKIIFNVSIANKGPHFELLFLDDLYELYLKVSFVIILFLVLK